MSICNMSIEAGARAGMIAPDETTFDYLKRPTALRRKVDSPECVRSRGCPYWATTADRSRARNTTRTLVAIESKRHCSDPSLVGHESARRQVAHRDCQSARTRRTFADEAKRASAAGKRPGVHGLDRWHKPLTRHLSWTIASLSARAQMRASSDLRAAAAVAPRATRLRRHRQARHGGAWVRGQVKRRSRRRRPRQASLSMPASNGARPAAACAWP